VAHGRQSANLDDARIRIPRALCKTDGTPQGNPEPGFDAWGSDRALSYFQVQPLPFAIWHSANRRIA